MTTLLLEIFLRNGAPSPWVAVPAAQDCCRVGLSVPAGAVAPGQWLEAGAGGSACPWLSSPWMLRLDEIGV